MGTTNLTVQYETLGNGQVLMARWLENGEPQSLATIASRDHNRREALRLSFQSEMEIKIGLKLMPEETTLFKNAMRYQKEWLNGR